MQKCPHSLRMRQRVGERHVFCTEVKSHTSQRDPLFYFLNRSRADFRLDSVAAFFCCCFRSASICRRSATVLRMTSCWCRKTSLTDTKTISKSLHPFLQCLLNFHFDALFISGFRLTFCFVGAFNHQSYQHCAIQYITFWFFWFFKSHVTLTLCSSWATCFLRLSRLPAELRPFFLCLGTNFSLAREFSPCKDQRDKKKKVLIHITRIVNKID